MNEVINQVLEGTLELVSRPNGWHQGAMANEAEDGTHQFCLMGAVMESSHLTCRYEYFSTVIDHLCKTGGLDQEGELIDILHPLASWNDSPDTTQEDVILLVKKAIYEQERV